MPELQQQDGSAQEQGDAEHVRFAAEIHRRAALPAGITTDRAATAVMGTLWERLTGGEVHKALTDLPVAVRALLGQREWHRQAPIAKFDRPEFLERVSREIGVTPAQAEAIAGAVFAAVRARLPERRIHDIANQLPGELADLWRGLRMEPGDDDVGVAPETARQVVLSELWNLAELPRGVLPEDAFSYVMCVFSRRLSGGEARHLLLGLPPTLRSLLAECVLHRREAPAVFDKATFLDELAEHLGADAADTERIARAVFTAVQRVLPQKEVHDAASQLPPDLRRLWVEPVT